VRGGIYPDWFLPRIFVYTPSTYRLIAACWMLGGFVFLLGLVVFLCGCAVLRVFFMRLLAVFAEA